MFSRGSFHSCNLFWGLFNTCDGLRVSFYSHNVFRWLFYSCNIFEVDIFKSCNDFWWSFFSSDDFQDSLTGVAKTLLWQQKQKIHRITVTHRIYAFSQDSQLVATLSQYSSTYDSKVPSPAAWRGERSSGSRVSLRYRASWLEITRDTSPRTSRRHSLRLAVHCQTQQWLTCCFGVFNRIFCLKSNLKLTMANLKVLLWIVSKVWPN